MPAVVTDLHPFSILPDPELIYWARSPGELKAAVSEAVDIDGPAIVDAIVVSNETLNLPHLDLDMIGHFAVAKIKEAVLAVTGG